MGEVRSTQRETKWKRSRQAGVRGGCNDLATKDDTDPLDKEYVFVYITKKLTMKQNHSGIQCGRGTGGIGLEYWIRPVPS